MMDVRGKIENAYKQINIDTILTKRERTVWRPFVCLWITSTAFLLYATFDTHPLRMFFSLLAWLGGSLGVRLLHDNYTFKKAMRRHGVAPTPGLCSVWSNTHYKAYELRKFYTLLYAEGLFTHTEADIELARHYQTYLEEEGTHAFINVSFAFFATILLFLLPVWDQFLTWVFNTHGNSLWHALSTAAIPVIFVLIALCIITLGAWRYTNFVNRTSIKFKRISRLMASLHTSLRVQYKKQN